MADPDPHEMVTCPYNAAHQVEHYRMHIHLQKCRKQHTASKKLICPFDATHVVNDVELDYHVSTCPKRHLFDSQVYVVDDACRPPREAPLPAPAPPPPASADECWDDDNVTSYKPDLARKGKHVIMKIKGATPSERRKARMEGQKNYRPLNDE